jgi:arginyl-tRNA synthetase
MLEQSKIETGKRHEDWSKEKITEAAEKISMGAMKFEMLKVGSDNIITFDINKALSFEGYTAAYLQYTYARIQSIFKKAKIKNKKPKINVKNLSEEKEGGLILKMAKYPEAVEKAGENYDSAEIAKYLFELAQMINDYYHAVPVLKAEEEIKKARLVLLSAACQVLENGLGFLGIEVLEEM